MRDVLRPPTRPGQHIPSPIRQHARRPRPDHQRLQLRHDNLLPLLPLRRTPLPDDLQETRPRRLDPDSDGLVVHRRLLPGPSHRSIDLLPNPGPPRVDRGRFHPRCRLVPHLLLQVQGIAYPIELFLGELHHDIHHQRFLGFWDPAFAGRDGVGWLAVDVCAGGRVYGYHWHCVMVLLAAQSDADEELVPGQGRVVYGAGGDYYG